MSERYTIGPSRAQSLVKMVRLKPRAGKENGHFRVALGPRLPDCSSPDADQGSGALCAAVCSGCRGALLSAAKIRSVAMR